jgi:hypothetical protein
LAYDGLPFFGSAPRDVLAVSVGIVRLQAGVTAVRGGGRIHWEAAVVDGLWCGCRWDLQRWDGGWRRPPVEGLLLDGTWVAPVAPEVPITLEALVDEARNQGEPGVRGRLAQVHGSAFLEIAAAVADVLDDDDLGMLGAGILETWFREEGYHHLKEIESAIRASRRVALAFHGVRAYTCPGRPVLDRFLTDVGLPPGPLNS